VGINPLRGPNDDNFGVRFPPLSDAYDLELRRRTHQAWKSLGLDKGIRRLHEGVYAFVAGPSYETRAECRMLRLLGADVVGMSTVPEIVVARHSGIRILAFSLVTNKAVLQAGVTGDDATIQGMNSLELEEYLSQGRANHEEVLEAGRLAAADMQVSLSLSGRTNQHGELILPIEISQGYCRGSLPFIVASMVTTSRKIKSNGYSRFILQVQ
jgi:purine-nucleoside phosphorylase